MTSVANPIIGWVDEPVEEGVVGPRLRVRGWALATSRIRAVEIRLDRHAFHARTGLERRDVAEARPGYPDNPFGGFECVADLRKYPAPPGIDRRSLSIVAIAWDGTESVLAERSLIEPAARERWRFAARGDATPFFLVPALSGVAAGGAHGLESRYSAYASNSTRIAMRVPILYLRTTTGAGDDYRFDSAFDVKRRCGDRAIADDSLADVLAASIEKRLPVLLTLNGGIWADSSGTLPEWDVIDRLEQDPANCQWNERNAVMPDDHLKHLPGSHAAPELARALTLNVYAADVRRYKKRNLQQVAGHLVAFMRGEPDLFVGVNVDPDVYINPFFSETQWYDYNPGTLHQFRHWLRGTGPYAGDDARDVPDLTTYRRAEPLSLDQVRDLAGRAFSDWDAVDPPRSFSREAARPYWNDPWVREWETFRRHLVALHYDELAQWLVDAGVPSDRIWSSQGLMAPADDCMPLALTIGSPVKNYDSGGVSIEGSKPRAGHLGAIVYGRAATNQIAMERGGTLFGTLAALDPGFAIVEFNPADLRHPERLPTYADAYRALRELWNAGARFASPMAWNGSNGTQSQSPDYVSYTAWRNTPFEEAARDFLLARSGLPVGTKLWTFGSQSHADDDGWTIQSGTMQLHPGALLLAPDALRRIVLVSPGGLALAQLARVVVGLPRDAPVVNVAVHARTDDDAEWQSLARADDWQLQSVEAGRLLRCRPLPDRIDRLRVSFIVDRRTPITLARIALLA